MAWVTLSQACPKDRSTEGPSLNFLTHSSTTSHQTTFCGFDQKHLLKSQILEIQSLEWNPWGLPSFSWLCRPRSCSWGAEADEGPHASWQVFHTWDRDTGRVLKGWWPQDWGRMPIVDSGAGWNPSTDRSVVPGLELVHPLPPVGAAATIPLQSCSSSSGHSQSKDITHAAPRLSYNPCSRHSGQSGKALAPFLGQNLWRSASSTAMALKTQPQLGGEWPFQSRRILSEAATRAFCSCTAEPSHRGLWADFSPSLTFIIFLTLKWQPARKEKRRKKRTFLVKVWKKTLWSGAEQALPVWPDPPEVLQPLLRDMEGNKETRSLCITGNIPYIPSPHLHGHMDSAVLTCSGSTLTALFSILLPLRDDLQPKKKKKS